MALGLRSVKRYDKRLGFQLEVVKMEENPCMFLRCNVYMAAGA